MDIQSKSNTIINNKAVCYLRVSTDRQEKEGNSIMIQKLAAEKYAEKNNLEIIDFYEESKSASKIPDENFDITGNIVTALNNRKELQTIIRLVKRNKFKHLIVYDRDRLVRNLEMFVALNFFLKKHNISVHYAKTNETINKDSDKINRFIELVLGSVAELEANLISVRVKEGQEQAIRTNKWPGGQTPYGYLDKKKHSNKFLQPSVSQMINVQKIFDFYNKFGYSYRRIAKEMNGVDNSINWTKGKIESILTNEVYTGQIVWNRRSRERNPDTNQEIIKSGSIKDARIISKTNWENSVSIRNKKSNIQDAKYYSTPYLLRDKLVCGNCGNLMKPKNYGKDKYGKQRECVYRCITKSNNRSELILRQTFIENIFINEFTNIMKYQQTDKLWVYYSSITKEIKEKNTKNLEKIINEIERKQSKLVKIDTLLDDALIDEIIETLEGEKTKLKKELNNLQLLKSRIEQLQNTYFNSMTELSSALQNFFIEDFNELENERKRMLLDILVDKVIVTNTDKKLILKIVLKSQLGLN
ncbi:recombinase family protein [Sporosalibacterium faouarense]|uniref:recombinase family protein n=1 Tax=Sporosalibacterium faouarense TaxID=516123 RepID=UPI00192AA838|nr:recombinase family protein [Sporosalibacterium faouarense]